MQPPCPTKMVRSPSTDIGQSNQDKRLSALELASRRRSFGAHRTVHRIRTSAAKIEVKTFSDAFKRALVVGQAEQSQL